MLTTILSGLSLGAVFMIVAVGYNVVFIASGIFNFAQAQFLMIGTFIALQAGQTLNLPLWVTVLLCALVGGLVGGLEENLAVRRLLGKSAHGELITTLGFGTVLSGVALLFFGSDAQKVTYFQDAGSVDIFGGRTNWVDLLVIISAVALAAVVGLVTRKTMLGLASLATSEDRQAAQLRGVSVTWLALGAFVIAGALVAATGPLVGAKTFAAYNLGDDVAVKAFVAITVGGIGSYRGVIIGGFVVGLLEVFASRYLGFEWQNIVVFVFLLVILVVLPRGLFGTKKERTV